MVITLVNYLKQYMKSDYYIKIKEKPILSINNPNIIMDIKNILYILRKEAQKEIGEIFILYPFTGNFNNKNIFVEFDAIYDFSQIDLLEDHPENNYNISYYSGFIYKNLYLNQLNINLKNFILLII